MENKLAKFISIAFHPILIPSLLFTIIFYFINYLSFSIPPSLKLILLSTVIITTCVVPIILFSLFYKLNFINSLLMENKEDRVLPLIIISVSYYSTYYIFRKLNLPAITTIIMLSACLTSIITLLINYKWKISIHSIGWGSITGIMIGISNFYLLPLIPIIAILFLISGFVAFSRLHLNAHNNAQVYFGFLIGFCTMLLIIH